MIPIKGNKSSQIHFNWPDRQKKAYFCFYMRDESYKQGPMSVQSANKMAKHYLREGICAWIELL